MASFFLVISSVCFIAATALCRGLSVPHYFFNVDHYWKL